MNWLARPCLEIHADYVVMHWSRFVWRMIVSCVVFNVVALAIMMLASDTSKLQMMYIIMHTTVTIFPWFGFWQAIILLAKMTRLPPKHQ